MWSTCFQWLFSKDTIDNASKLFGILSSIAVIFGIISLYLSKKQLHVTTMRHCIGDYRRIFRDQQKIALKINVPKSEQPDAQILKMDILGLVNEELFYIQEGYIPKDISLEWISSMLDYLPVLDAKGNVLKVPVLSEGSDALNKKDPFKLIAECSSYNNAAETSTAPLAFYFPKVKRCFTVRSIDAHLSKNEIIIKIYKNIRPYWIKRYWRKVFWKRRQH
jgi:hypothetical protein